MAKQQQPKRPKRIGILGSFYVGCLLLPPIGLLIASVYFFLTRHTHDHLGYGIVMLVVTVIISPVAIYRLYEFLGQIQSDQAEKDYKERRWQQKEKVRQEEEARKEEIRQQEEDLEERTWQAEGELDKHIQAALMKMESIGGSYGNEENANQQLCLILRELMPGADIQLVKHGRAGEGQGDIRMGNTIIEGKLDLEHKDEMDRLVGQLQDYCSSTSCEVRVVVYGRLRPDFRRRIEGLPQYFDRILLHHIGGTKTRKPAA
jgi:hypothetical protein